MKTLKKESVYHSDARLFNARPLLHAAPGELDFDPDSGGALSYQLQHAEKEDWRSKIKFLNGFASVFNSPKYRGFTQFLIRTVEQETHEKVMALGRECFHKIQINGTSVWDMPNEQEAARRVRDFIKDVYVYSFQVGFYDRDSFVKNAKSVLKREPLREGVYICIIICCMYICTYVLVCIYVYMYICAN